MVSLDVLGPVWCQVRPSSRKIEPAGHWRLAAELHARPAREHDLDAQQIVGGEPVFEAMQPAGIFRHIAADGAGDLAGGIGRVIKAFRFHRPGDVEIGHARFGRDAAIFEIDLQDPFHAAHADQDSVGARQRPA